MSTLDATPLNLVSILENRAALEKRIGAVDPAEIRLESNRTEFEEAKKHNRPSQTTLYTLQAKQVKLLETQTVQLERIGDFLEDRNKIEKEKLEIMKRNQLD